MPFKKTVKPYAIHSQGESIRREHEEHQRYKESVLDLTERAFRKYADCHKGATQEQKELECQRFLKILKSML